MRVSQKYKLKRKQAELDFVDVPLDTDLPVFVEPTAIRAMDTPWSSECVALLQNFFSNVLSAVKKGEKARAVSLLGSLNERNDFHLGYSSGESRGHAFGKGSAGSVWESLLTSKAAKSGVLSDLEDTALLIEGVGADMISDAVCNIIRAPLIEYTQDMCRYYGIPMVANVSSGPCWDMQAQNWVARHVELPMPKGESLVLVPKSIVRLAGAYDAGAYYRHYLLPELQKQHLASGSGLVEVLKSKKRRVTKTALMRHYGKNKDAVAKLTEDNPDVLAKYKKAKAADPSPPISNSAFAEIENVPNVQLYDLYKDVVAVPPGRARAHDYERAVEGLLSALLYPSLIHPVRQAPINQGRKIVDLRFSNSATAGFFSWLSKHYTAPYVFVEFKNYTEDVKNPELDQLSGRFSKSGGQVGILICRAVSDRKKIDAMCRDAAKDGRGYMIVLDDADLETLVKSTTAMHYDASRTILNDRFDQLVL
ncbi:MULTISPECIES: hypothetical protein [Stenotrophomonas]|uniref:Restriction endonuclease type IV Mrr domain-containing protein n=1 Tax=Stenotrophomonas lactitubi TaxID=2045214 RepID=A0AAW4GIV5_9GAMM|nr:MULTISPECIES: hypothetical protein [Stenotrophomonas]MBM9913967.1 hypothetical protein [Stenotrophomonas lactitubi]MBM9921960.1 hypothetical protein [Stenotrophomonas lactitubi]MBM9936525.1 hypothetical protein [Stenotrophomonas lactitubi]